MRFVAIILFTFFFSVALSHRKPINLLARDDTKTKLVIVPQGIDILRKMGSTRMAVIVFIGRMRSGKSYSLNTILGADHEIGFEVGHTDRPKTVGAYIWPEPIVGKGECNFSYIIIDTEGIGSGIQTYDKALLTVAMVLSSKLVYHLEGYVYFDDTSKLYSIANLALYYERRGLLKKRGSDLLLPPLMWIVQRYKLEHEESEQVPEDVLHNIWLHEVENPNDDRLVGMFNTTVRVVKNVFPKHTVHLIPDPLDCSGSVGSNVHLTDVATKDLCEGYIKGMDAVRNELFDCSMTRPRGDGGGLTGNEIASLLEEIVEPANIGIDYMGDKVTEIVMRSMTDEAAHNMEASLNSAVLPQWDNDLEIFMSSIHRTAEDALLANMPTTGQGVDRFMSRPFLDVLDGRFRLVRDNIIEKNKLASDVRCDEAMKTASVAIDDPKKFRGDLNSFDRIADVAISTYDAASLGPKTHAYRMKLYEKIRISRSIVMADGAPRRRMIWAIVSAAIAFTCHAVAGLLSKIPRVEWIWLTISFMELMVMFVAAFAAWAVLGDPPISFDYLADILTTTAKTMVRPYAVYGLTSITVVIVTIKKFKK